MWLLALFQHRYHVTFEDEKATVDSLIAALAISPISAHRTRCSDVGKLRMKNMTNSVKLIEGLDAAERVAHFTNDDRAMNAIDAARKVVSGEADRSALTTDETNVQAGGSKTTHISYALCAAAYAAHAVFSGNAGLSDVAVMYADSAELYAS